MGAVEKDRTTVLGDFNGDGRGDFAFIDPRGTTSIVSRSSGIAS